ncbi:hypothetical protein [Rhizobium terrae]|uniref:hypothetical protein n=1 Tax=Rhizobium terrae TaxID=2171756 RepID=UPI000E3B6C47|nr:hypothetical protein [Rhizobium terrae]
MIVPYQQLISCVNEKGTVVTVIRASRQPDRPLTGEEPSVVYYTSDGYLVERISDDTFRIILTGEKLIRG